MKAIFKELLYLNEPYTTHILGLDIEIVGRRDSPDSKILIILQSHAPGFPKVKEFDSEASCKCWIGSILRQIYLERKGNNSMKITQLERNAPLVSQRSMGGHATIDGIRNIVVRDEQKRNFRFGVYDGKKRISIHRGHVKIATIEVEDCLDDEEIIKNIKKEILKGSFDYELITVYRRVIRHTAKRLFVSDIAQIAKVHSNTIRRWCNDGKITHFKRDHSGYRVFHPDAILEVQQLAGTD